MIKISPGPGFARYWIDPKLIGPDGRANPEYLGAADDAGRVRPVHLSARARTSGTWTRR